MDCVEGQVSHQIIRIDLNGRYTTGKDQKWSGKEQMHHGKEQKWFGKDQC